jgi:hypothetical protein
LSSPVIQRPFSIQPPLRGYDTLFQNLINSIPAGTFYDFSHSIVLWQANPNLFIFNTDNYGIPVHVTVQRTGDYHPNVNQANLITESFFTPQNPQTSFSVTLGLGLNRLVAQEMITGGRKSVLEIIATPNDLVLDSIATQINVPQTNLTNIQSALYSKYATRMLDQVIKFHDLLPDFQSLKIISTKLAIRGMVHFPGEILGVNNVINAFSLNNPVYRDQRQSRYEVEKTSIMRSQELFAGQEAHIWFPNILVTRWLAFTRMANAFRNLYTINSVTDIEVDVDFKNRNQIHEFSLTSPGANFLNSVFSDCFDNIQMQMTSGMVLNHRVYMWSYSFDEIVMTNNPIGVGRLYLDMDVPLDSGIPFDADPIDPFTDGWVGWSLSGRFDQDRLDSSQSNYALDSNVDPGVGFSGIDPVYAGPYTQMLNTLNSEIDLDAATQINSAGTNWDGYVGSSVVGLDLQIPEGTLTAGVAVQAYAKYVDHNGMSNLSGAGTIDIQESNGGTLETVTVTSGYEPFMLTPTKVGNITWSLSDGLYSGSQTRKVVVGSFAAFRISTIANQQVGVPFSVQIQAIDACGNDVTDLGINTRVTIVATDGLTPGSVTPTYVETVNGAAIVELTLSVAGSGTLTFSALPVSSPSNFFSVN